LYNPSRTISFNVQAQKIRIIDKDAVNALADGALDFPPQGFFAITLYLAVVL
jgi:hypothetical protein